MVVVPVSLHGFLNMLLLVQHKSYIAYRRIALQVRSMKDNFGDKDAATPSTAVQMSGLNSVPIAGDDFTVAKSLEEVSCH